MVAPRIQRSPVDGNDRYQLTISPPHERLFSEAFAIQGARTKAEQYLDGHPRIQPMVDDTVTLVVCGPDRCLLADSFVPRF